MEIYLTAGDASRVLGVSPATVKLIAGRGELRVAARTEGGIKLFRREDVTALATRRNQGQPPANGQESAGGPT